LVVGEIEHLFLVFVSIEQFDAYDIDERQDNIALVFGVAIFDPDFGFQRAPAVVANEKVRSRFVAAQVYTVSSIF